MYQSTVEAGKFEHDRPPIPKQRRKEAGINHPKFMLQFSGVCCGMLLFAVLRHFNQLAEYSGTPRCTQRCCYQTQQKSFIDFLAAHDACSVSKSHVRQLLQGGLSQRPCRFRNGLKIVRSFSAPSFVRAPHLRSPKQPIASCG